MSKFTKMKIILITTFFLVLTACAENISRPKKGTIKALSYLALGDSYTIGESVKTNERWPIQLEKLILSKGTKLNTTIIAKTGWRTDNLLNAANEQISNQKFDLVSLLIGVNNEYQGQSPDGFETKFRACLDFAVSHSKKGKSGVFIVSIPDYGFTPYGKPNQKKISTRLTKYNNICKSVAEDEGIVFIDITPISQDGLKNSSLVASDGLHPSGKQYALWVNLMLPKIMKMIS